jgi:hypothetical protein
MFELLLFIYSSYYFLYVRVITFYIFELCSRLGRNRLLEVMLHVTLEVEVGELVSLGNLKKLGELGIGVDNTTIRLVLQVVRANVGVNVLADLGASHLGTNLLTKELGELVTDDGGLHESGGLSVARAATLLAGSLCRQLHLTRHDLLKGLEITLHGREETNELLELGAELSHLHGNGRSLGGSRSGSLDNGGSSRSKGNLINGGSGLGNDLLGSLGLGGRGGGGGSSSGGSSSLRCSNHSGLYILHKCHLFK